MKLRAELVILAFSLVLSGIFASSNVEARKGETDQVTLSATLLAGLSQKGLI
jgi:hypothetical protein